MASERESRPSPRSAGGLVSWIRKLSLAALSLLAALLVGELVVRLQKRGAGQAHDPQATLLSLWNLATGMSADLDEGEVVMRGDMGTTRVMLHPYLGFDSSSGLEQYSEDLALFQRPDSREIFDVAILGGSVASIVSMSAEQVLIETLHQDPRLADREIRVLCYSRGAFKQPQQVNMLTYLLNLGVEPDAVINIDGYNELANNPDSENTHVHPIQPLASFWTSVVASVSNLDETTFALRQEALERTVGGRTLVLRFSRLKLQHSALAAWVAARLLHRNRALLVAAQNAYTARLPSLSVNIDGSPSKAMLGPRLPEGVSPIDCCVRIWLESSRILQAICSARGIGYVHVLQPTLHDEGSKPLSEEEIRTSSVSEHVVRAVRQGYPMMRELGQTLAAEGVAFRDASRLFVEVDQTLYYDACHFNSPGTDMVARVAAQTLLDAMPMHSR